MSAPETTSLIKKTITETVRTVSHKSLSVPYVSYLTMQSGPKVMPYPLVEVFAEYGVEPKCLDALMTMVEKSDCPYVAAWRLAIAERFAEANAEEVEEVMA